MNHARFAVLTLWLPLLACTPRPAAESAGRLAHGDVNCVSADAVSGRRPDGPRSLRFEMTDGMVYRNALPDACPSLERWTDLDVITFELHGSQICSGDTFRVVDPAQARAVGLGAFPSCRLGPFTPVGNTR